MTQATALPHDALSGLADAQAQRQAAQMVQQCFAETFRQAMNADPQQAGQAMQEIARRCDSWCRAGENEDTRLLRRAFLVSGLDQWGLAYSQAFQLKGIPALSALLGALRSPLAPQADARLQWYFDQIERIESDAIDFKVELRRSIHLALWHAMAACEDETEADTVVQALGSLLLALEQRMPQLGWRLVADALASIQLSLLADANASVIAQSGTERLFAALRQALPAETHQTILAHAGQVVVAWQRAQRRDDNAS